MLTTLRARSRKRADNKGVPNCCRRTRRSRSRAATGVGRAVGGGGGSRVQAPIATATCSESKRRHLRRQPRSGRHARSAASCIRRLRFAFDFPQGGRSRQPAAGGGEEPDAEALMMLQIVPLRREPDDPGHRRRVRCSGGLPDCRRIETTINGLEALRATYVGMLEGSAVKVSASTCCTTERISGRRDRAGRGVRRRRPAFAAAFVVPSAVRRRSRTHSPDRIDLYTARDGDTWQSHRRAASEALVTTSTLAVMNEAHRRRSAASGERIKIVVGG